MAVEWTEVDSSNIAAIGISEEVGELHVQFKSGAVYVYHDVPADTAQEFLDADSKGKFLNERIKGVYEASKL